jgi:transcriptional regulator with PAS, ATPase and Fis domain
MNRKRIGFLCSFDAQRDQIEQVAATIADEVEVSIELGTMEDAVQPAKKLEREGVEVLVAWDGTAAMLQRNVSIPVVSIQIRDLDIMRALNQARELGKHIILFNAEPLSGMELLEKLYDVRIRQIGYKNINDVKYGFMDALNEGFDVVLGKSYLALDLAREYKKKVILIAFTREAILKSIQEAVKIADIRRREREEFMRLKTIFNSLTEGVLVVDSAGNVALINPAAERLFDIEGSKCLGRPAADFLPKNHIMEALNKKERVDYDFLDLKDLSVIAAHEPVLYGERVIGVSSTFRTVSEIQKMDHKIRNKEVSRGFTTRYGFETFSAESPVMKEVIQQAKVFATTDSTILITGETGTGKEVMAQSIHKFSRRSSRSFVATNCSAIAENLLESELFGYEEGAFTGARKGGKMGLFELAHEGTLFLDEIGSMPLTLQSRLLRVLEERKVMRIGGERLIPIDVRIIAATNRDLLTEVKKGLFRQDLYYRLNVLSLTMPPLRQRHADLPELIDSFVLKFSNKYKRKKIELSNEVVQILTAHHWPGNVRELENFIERIVLLAHTGKPIADLACSVLQTHFRNEPDVKACPKGQYSQNDDNHSKGSEMTDLLDAKRRRILAALEQVNFNVSRASSFLGISRSTLYRRMKHFGLLS